jgi:hypothetical protein
MKGDRKLKEYMMPQKPRLRVGAELCFALLASILLFAFTHKAESAEKKVTKYKRGQWIHPRKLGPGRHPSKLLIAWESKCKKPEGSGLAFSGLHQTATDGRPHTRILKEGKWVEIYDELREKNPLQKYCDRANEMKTQLMRARARARHIYFKGLKENEQKRRVASEATPLYDAFKKDFARLLSALKEPGKLEEYEKTQVSFAVKHLNAAQERIQRVLSPLSADHINALQEAEVEIAMGADALDAEPTPRVMSDIVYDSKTGLYVLFGGDHFDYLMNDTWVFDSKKRKWEQRHPEKAPEPRGKHSVSAPGNGTVTVEGGYYYDPKGNNGTYRYIGGDAWTYDIVANTWKTSGQDKPWRPDTRTYWGRRFHPKALLAGPRPDAAANEAKLKALPINTWVNMKPPVRPAGNRDWGTVALDTDRDQILHWNGGHSAYCATDVAHYHLSVNRWEVPYAAELPLGMIGASGAALSGYSFGKRHWITNHSWNSYTYDPGLNRMVVAGSMSNWQFKWDPYFYIYDSGLGEWSERHRKPFAQILPGGVLLTLTRDGVLCFIGKGHFYLLDRKTMKWKHFKVPEIKIKSSADWTGFTYDAKRDMAMLVGRSGHNMYKGKVIHAVDMKTRKYKKIVPENPEILGNGFYTLREWRYIPDLDLFVFADGLRIEKEVKGKKKLVAGTVMPAYSPANNRWLTLAVKGSPGYGFSTGMRYDQKRKLLWVVHSRSTVHALRLDLGELKKTGLAK